MYVFWKLVNFIYIKQGLVKGMVILKTSLQETLHRDSYEAFHLTNYWLQLFKQEILCSNSP